MTFKELCDWVKLHKKLDSQVVIALQEDTEPDTILDGVGPVCFLPFVAAYHKAGKIGKIQMEESYRIYIDLWEDEKNQVPLEPYTWGDFVNWIETVPENTLAQALAAWHLCDLKIVNDILYAYEV